jgi:hypothetical protein
MEREARRQDNAAECHRRYHLASCDDSRDSLTGSTAFVLSFVNSQVFVSSNVIATFGDHVQEVVCACSILR